MIPDAAVEAGARAVHSLTVQGHKDFRLMSGSWRGRFLAESAAVLEAASETIACPAQHLIYKDAPHFRRWPDRDEDEESMEPCESCGGSGVLHILRTR